MASNKAKGLMQAVWIKAFETGELKLSFTTKNEALKARFMLYNVRKAALKDFSDVAMLLRLAAEECEISMLDEKSFVIRHSTAGEIIQQMAEQSGISLEDSKIIDQIEFDAEESSRRLMERLEREAEGAKIDLSTPTSSALSASYGRRT